MYILLTIFFAYILSGRADIRNLYLGWEKKKYIEIDEFVRENKDSEKLKVFENIIKELSKVQVDLYDIYILRFYENQSQEYIAKETGLNKTPRVTEKLDIILNAFISYKMVLGKAKELVEID